MLESMEQMERRHEREKSELREQIKSLVQTAKKSQRTKVETEALQMEYALKEKHMEEIANLEEYVGTNDIP